MEKIKAAQIGCGGRNGAHFQKLSSFADVDIVGFCDIIPERAEARRNAYGSGKAYTDYVQMLDETNPDVVFIAVPPRVHGEIEPELIKRKIHFLVEKPMALDYSVAEHICDEAEKAGILTAVGFQDRYQSLTDIMKDYIKDKQIGLVSGGWLGGIPGVPNLKADATVRRVCRDFAAEGKVVAAICAAPTALAAFGVLNGKKATVYPGMDADLTAAGASYTGLPLTIDGSIVTGEALGAAIPFALALARILAGADAANRVKSAIVYQ